MGRLLTLRLSAKVSRPLPEPPVQYSTPPPNYDLPPPPVPAKSPRRPSSILRETMPPSVPSLDSGIGDMLSPLPTTSAEWGVFLDDVRRLYVKRQYKQCSERCVQALEDAPGSLLPLHSIYLSFYAATCLELTARPLHANSPQKTLLFELARFHYQKAEYHLADATIEDKSMRSQVDHLRKTSVFSNNSMSSSRGSLDSSAASIFSRGDSASPTPSPTSSICSYSSIQTYQYKNEHEDPLKPRPLSVKKRGAFTPTLPTVISVPDINGGRNRPTSPTHRRSNAINLSTIRTALWPSPSAKSDCTVTTSRSRAGSDATIASVDSILLSSAKKVQLEMEAQSESADYHPPTPSPSEDREVGDDCAQGSLVSSSIARYNMHLESMATQLSYHIAVLETLAEEMALTKSHKTASLTTFTPSTPTTCLGSTDYTLARETKRGNKPDFFDKFEGLGQEVSERELEEEAQQERKQRMRRARMAQWLNRERFDGRKWEELADKALRELNY